MSEKFNKHTNLDVYISNKKIFTHALVFIDLIEFQLKGV